SDTVRSYAAAARLGKARSNNLLPASRSRSNFALPGLGWAAWFFLWFRDRALSCCCQLATIAVSWASSRWRSPYTAEPGAMLTMNSRPFTMNSRPFDSLEYCFEIKYDGVRALAAVDERGWRLWGRERADYTARYPELDELRRLPGGTLVDGELVAFDEGGRPDLRRLLRRHGLTDPWRSRPAQQWCPGPR